MIINKRPELIPVVEKINREMVVLVDENDVELGVMEKLAAHKGHGYKHRAITIVLYRDSGNKKEVLLQKRGEKKPLWPLYWDGTVSTHPRRGESYETCGVRRLKEEMGIDVGEEQLQLLYKQVYSAQYNQELAENEVNGVFVGNFNGSFLVNPLEVAEAKWVEWEWLVSDVKKNEDQYAKWFVMMFEDREFVEAKWLK